MIELGNDWDELLKDEYESEYYQEIRAFLKQEYKEHTVYPSMYDIFNALRWTAYKDVKVVIIGQDPYHGENQAHGLSFSVKKGVPTPPSLVNIYKEIQSDLGIAPPNHGYLEEWARQGVLLLNATLTVRAAQANSHQKIGWQKFTDKIIQLLNERNEPMVFMLWGANAKKKKLLITNTNHLILESVHPSPLSAYNGFFGCKHFSKANDFLKQYTTPIDWQIHD